MSTIPSTVLISGGASGLGEATARRFSADGWHVAILDRDGDRARSVAAELGDAAAIQVDVTDADAVDAAVAAVVAEGHTLRLAVSCAGIGPPQRLLSRRGPHPVEAFHTILAVNLFGTFHVLRAAAMAMAENELDEDGQRGAIVNTASIAAYDGQIGQVAYAASKGGIVGMTLPAARDLADRFIRVCTIAPGLFRTPLLASLPQEAQDSLGASVPNPARLGEPAEYAALVAHIASNPMLNGEVIRLDGALRMAPR
ncbi:MAG: short-chain dehydrogenase/reductase [Solirubrobacterales bacterium]|jgi:NAD(P)-dependent dehydrogenase (short-subunit alcohol dehydrogenase family)|nr:short-chain dehydrogenase/reductase [Solirubrobacterales bacterium]